MAAKSSNLYVRIEPEVKEEAEKILSTLGIPASSAVNMFYKQIILHNGLPFDVKIPETVPSKELPKEKEPAREVSAAQAAGKTTNKTANKPTSSTISSTANKLTKGVNANKKESVVIKKQGKIIIERDELTPEELQEREEMIEEARKSRFRPKTAAKKPVSKKREKNLTPAQAIEEYRLFD